MPHPPLCPPSSLYAGILRRARPACPTMPGTVGWWPHRWAAALSSTPPPNRRPRIWSDIVAQALGAIEENNK